MTIYVDGSLKNSTSFGNYKTGNNIRIGEPADRSTGSNAEGVVDDVRIYNKGLSDTESSNLHNRGSI